jgi:hypothetical protein
LVERIGEKGERQCRAGEDEGKGSSTRGGSGVGEEGQQSTSVVVLVVETSARVSSVGLARRREKEVSLVAEVMQVRKDNSR